MKPTRNILMLITSVLVLCGVGCTVTTHKHEARPVEAKLEIYTVGPDGKPRWITNQRTVYTYREDDE